MLTGLPAGAQELARDFLLPLPLFSSGSPWNQRAGGAVRSDSRDQILVLYRVLLGDRSSLRPLSAGVKTAFPFAYVSASDFTIPIFQVGTGLESIRLRRYDGSQGATNAKIPSSAGGTVTLPAPAGKIRPSGPSGIDSDGHVVLFDAVNGVEYDYWQATTARDAQGNSLGGGQSGTSILETGTVDRFDVRERGTNPPRYSSARATGTPLLAGMILPEDVERGSIEHALAFAIPGPRNTNAADPSEPFASDYFDPASTTEAEFFNTNPKALAAGQRLRLRSVIVDDSGATIDESSLAAITRMFLAALRTYGAYLVDNAGGFAFVAEDFHTAVVHLTDDQIRALTGRPAGAPLPPDKTKWELLIERLNSDLERIPLSSGPWYEYGPGKKDPAAALLGIANFEVVEQETRTGGRRRAMRP